MKSRVKALLAAVAMAPFVLGAQGRKESVVVLASFEVNQDKPRFWTDERCKASVVASNASEGVSALCVTPTTRGSSVSARGVVLCVPKRLTDWSKFDEVRADVFVTEEAAPLWWISRIRAGKMRNGVEPDQSWPEDHYYAESQLIAMGLKPRSNLKPGWNKNVTLATMEHAGRTVVLTDVKEIFIYTEAMPDPGARIFIDNIRLVSRKK